MILMDNSKEMIHVLEEKLKVQNISHLKPLWYNMETQGEPDMRTDVIFTQMAMHHVRDIEKTLQAFYQMINPGGLLAIADLYTEDGSFHDQDFDGHLGFDPQELSVNLAACGFRNMKYEECYAIERINEQGQSKKYPIFILIAEK
jgi:2-polyprenyl-3-methyl-5-hydroxy-6-metoxy-1,4-benzoquinol methylase